MGAVDDDEATPLLVMDEWGAFCAWVRPWPRSAATDVPDVALPDSPRGPTLAAQPASDSLVQPAAQKMAAPVKNKATGRFARLMFYETSIAFRTGQRSFGQFLQYFQTLTFRPRCRLETDEGVGRQQTLACSHAHDSFAHPTGVWKECAHSPRVAKWNFPVSLRALTRSRVVSSRAFRGRRAPPQGIEAFRKTRRRDHCRAVRRSGGGGLALAIRSAYASIASGRAGSSAAPYRCAE